MTPSLGARGAALLIVVAGIVALPACGRKTEVKPPELVAPAAIDTLVATNAGDGIHLTWRRPRTYVDGARMTDLGSFRVDRLIGQGPFSTVATIPVTDQERIQQERRFRWIDTNTVVGESYLYRVYSSTTDGYVSRSSNLIAIERQIPTPAPTALPTASPTSRP